MSIIYDALNKLEEAARPAFGQNNPKKKRRSFKVYAVYLLAAFLGLFSAKALFSFIAFSPSPSAGKQEVLSQAPLLTVAQEVKPVAIEKRPQLPSLVLNGIVISVDGSYALINNRVVKEGNKINGAIVVRIYEDNVELNTENAKSVKLYLNNAT